MSELSYSDELLRSVLRDARSIAGFGMSANTIRPSWYVGNYMHQRGYRVIAVNPGAAGQTIFGQEAVARLADIPQNFGPVEMLDVFRRSEQVLPVVEEAVEALLGRGLKHVWMQIGVINREAAALAESHGLTVVMDRCPKMEYQRLCGELSWGGINSGIISSRLRND